MQKQKFQSKVCDNSPRHNTEGRSLPELSASNFEVLQDFLQNRISKVL